MQVLPLLVCALAALAPAAFAADATFDAEVDNFLDFVSDDFSAADDDDAVADVDVTQAKWSSALYGVWTAALKGVSSAYCEKDAKCKAACVDRVLPCAKALCAATGLTTVCATVTPWTIASLTGPLLNASNVEAASLCNLALVSAQSCMTAALKTKPLFNVIISAVNAAFAKYLPASSLAASKAAFCAAGPTTALGRFACGVTADLDVGFAPSSAFATAAAPVVFDWEFMCPY
jgi:hypothetical protein